MSTSDSVPAVRIEVLLADSAWVHGLARNLLDQPGRAEDMVQETWLAALEHGPRTDTNLRGWLATVARNAVRKTLRGEARRRGREAQVARADTAPTTLEVVERFSTHHAVATAVLALEEPFRETILLRYYEDLPRADIAESMGVALSTVDGRIQRGLEKLRRALDRGFGGDGRSWAVALVPLAVRRAATGSSALGVPLAL
ncbi:MAG: RNA polymerase sigma factor, partial [Planctomycetota bacterium]|nr:RNA polymerase sigma factor [Planctomycetota bacterium]